MSSSRFITLGILIGLLLLVDLYVFQAVKAVAENTAYKRFIYSFYWAISILSVAGIFWYNFVQLENVPINKTLIIGFVFVNYFSKLFVVIILFIDDFIRLSKWIASFFSKNSATIPTTSTPVTSEDNHITRSDFLMKTALIAGAVPLATMSFGILSGAHDYRIRRKTLYLPNLPKAFDGIRIAQLSDIHSGSFFNKVAVKGGVEMLLSEKPDVIFFTGDLVNNTAKEVEEYVPIFEKVKAPLGVYTILGNHDYGDYVRWNSLEAKQQNLEDLITAHQQMGWDLLLDEHRFIEVDKEKIAVIGVENWGTGRFPKYGNLSEAYKGVEEAPVKLLLSHDPSHWDAQIRPQFPDIDLTLSGHTHGMQFGIEIGDFRWSPVKYRYKQWADLYKEGNQYLYVNRGYGYIGFPGRVGILPEITLLELKTSDV